MVVSVFDLRVKLRSVQRLETKGLRGHNNEQSECGWTIVKRSEVVGGRPGREELLPDVTNLVGGPGRRKYRHCTTKFRNCRYMVMSLWVTVGGGSHQGGSRSRKDRRVHQRKKRLPDEQADDNRRKDERKAVQRFPAKTQDYSSCGSTSR
jgi:hypothetical protein